MITHFSKVGGENFGGKTLVLRRLMEKGYNVPKFVAVGADQVLGLFDGRGKVLEEKVENLAQEIFENFQCKRYAVRSSALVEDTGESAMAGQFETVLKVSPGELKDALIKVLKQGYEYLKGDVGNFSVLVQEFIDADYAGVTFTRNPLGGREMVVEYSEGVGEKIVGGEVNPVKMAFYWNGEIEYELCDFDVAIEIFKNIEGLFGEPQDIEWCIKDDALYILQARPITTLNEVDYKGYLYLDEKLPRERFFYEKTEVSEIAERPTTFTLSLLERIYGRYGPVERVYAKYGVKYVANDFLKVVGNELYVDREKELQTLLPSYSYFKGEKLKPEFCGWGGIWRTVWNVWKLNRISLSAYHDLKEEVQEKLGDEEGAGDFEGALKRFLGDYELIFEINLLTEKALKKLEKALEKEEISVVEVLSAAFEKEEEAVAVAESDLKGNCLEISDESDFMTQHYRLKKSVKVTEWFEDLAEWKKKFLKPIIIYAQQYSRLREYGRWLTVKNVNYLRRILFEMAEKAGFGEKRNVFFLNVGEILEGILSEDLSLERREEYLIGDDFKFGVSLANKVVKKDGELMGVSGGVAEGVLVDLEGMKEIVGGNKVLYTKVLGPELVGWFGEVEGIVSENGGLLSHLAIMARENEVPVIVGFDMKREGIFIGDFVKIDADKSAIKKKDK